MNEYAASQNFDLSARIISILDGASWDGQEFLPILKQYKREFFTSSSRIFAAVFIPAAILLSTNLLLSSGSSAQRTTAFLCRMSCIAPLTAVFADMQNISLTLTKELIAFSDKATPVLIGASMLSGAENAAASLNPLSALCANMIQNLLIEWGIPVCSAAAGIAAAGSMSSSLHLKKLYDLLKRLVHWGTGSLIAAFTAILTLQGRLNAGRDSISSRTARYAIENLLPVIGGNVSNSLDSLLSTANAVKNAIGLSGLLLLAYVCLLPLTKLLSVSLLLRLTAAIVEPLGDDTMTAFSEQLAGSVEMLLIVSAAAALLCGLLTGSCITAVSGIIR